ncbi:FecR family protein [Phenylobacterium sp.]|uniref:FecR family protein n=1 Tax=Phenylobacterium sp. TaxID=1871053 RepID=UPI0025E0A5A1|nr:FecR domain-containing protein [Phenylobacterium sp.]
MVVVGAGSGWMFLNLRTVTYATGVGEQRRVLLADGSRLSLDADSYLKVRMTGASREVRLKRGRAFFDVAHDTKRPFNVVSGQTETRAVGTRFGVSNDNGLVRVTLVQGSVEVRTRADDAAPATKLSPGQQLIADLGKHQERVVLVDAASATSWVSGRVVFRDTTLREAISEVNRYSRRKIVLEPSDLGAAAIAGSFDVGDTDSFVTGVRSLFDLKSHTGDDGSIVLTK